NSIRAAVAQRNHQVRSFASDVETRGNAKPLERLLLDEAFTNGLEHGHLLPGPFDLALAGVSQAQVLYITFFHFSGCQCAAPLILSLESRTECIGGLRNHREDRVVPIRSN